MPPFNSRSAVHNGDPELFTLESDLGESSGRLVSRRTMLQQSATALAGCVLSIRNAFSKEADSHPAVHTVLGPVAPDKLGVTLMHEHAPLVDWSELYEAPPAPVEPVRERMLTDAARLLDRFHASLSTEDGPGAIVEATPIRVGRDPQLLVDLARRTKVHRSEERR